MFYYDYYKTEIVAIEGVFYTQQTDLLIFL